MRRTSPALLHRMLSGLMSRWTQPLAFMNASAVAACLRRSCPFSRMKESSLRISRAFRLPDPFLVLATQNPVEYEGTYPLPEAQQDRFLFKVVLDYPTPEQELEVVDRWNRGIELKEPVAAGLQPVLDAAAIAECQQEVRAITVDEKIRRYIIELAVATRTPHHS